MRTIFIPGFGEDETIFNRLTPLIPGEKMVLNIWKLVEEYGGNTINAINFAREFISKYQVKDRDVLIGHSLGGWIAYHVKHLVNCPIIQVASMTNTDRIIPPVINHPAFYWAIKKGLVFNSFTQWLSLLLVYNNRPSKEIFAYITDMLKNGNKNDVKKQLQIILKEVDEAISVQPDLRIHSPKDTILKPPEEPYYQVPGDHFALYTHPEEVCLPISNFLKKIAG